MYARGFLISQSRTYRGSNLFPEVAGRLEKLGFKQIQQMSHNAKALGHKPYTEIPDTYKDEDPPILDWSPSRRFINPDEVWRGKIRGGSQTPT